VASKGVRDSGFVRELNNERIDIVPYTSSPEVFCHPCAGAAKVVHIDTFDIEKKMTWL